MAYPRTHEETVKTRTDKITKGFYRRGQGRGQGRAHKYGGHRRDARFAVAAVAHNPTPLSSLRFPQSDTSYYGKGGATYFFYTKSKSKTDYEKEKK